MLKNKLTKEIVDRVFENERKKEKPHQLNPLLELYYIAVGGKEVYDKIVSIKGYPKTNEAMNKYLFKMFIDFDKEFHPTILSVGLWMNSGFSSYNIGEAGEEGFVFLDENDIVYKQ
jgi:hypothetical protein